MTTRGIEMQPVNSGNLESAGYDDQAQALFIKFKTGQTYRYANVPRRVFDELMAAESKGRYFAAVIRLEYKAERL